MFAVKSLQLLLLFVVALVNGCWKDIVAAVVAAVACCCCKGIVAVVCCCCY